MARFRFSWQPGFLAPLLVGAALVANVALRVLPMDRVSYRVWEALRTFGAETPFRPHARYDRPRVYGNLAALGNQIDLRQYHRVVFTTDSLGYHNPPGFAATDSLPPGAILFGSSFSAGAEVSDGEDLAARLGALAGRRVYNAAPGEPAPATVETLARQVGLDGGVVFYEYYEGSAPPAIRTRLPDPRELRCRKALGAWTTQATCNAFTWAADHLEVSPLQVFAARIYRHAENGVLLPNAAAARVIRARLSNGAETLFLALERDILHSERAAEEADRYFTWLARQLALRGRRLLVVLAPQKYTVYAPLLQAPDPGPEASVHYLAEVERRLAARGIAVVNLVEPLRAAARSALEADSLIYWRDDTHWNAAGNDIAARVIAPALERLWDEAK